MNTIQSIVNIITIKKDDRLIALYFWIRIKLVIQMNTIQSIVNIVTVKKDDQLIVLYFWIRNKLVIQMNTIQSISYNLRKALIGKDANTTPIEY